MTRKQKGFTLIELLIVVAIIGILAAIAIPNLLTAMQRSRQKRSMADMRTISSAWESRATDTNNYAIAGAKLTWPAATIQITAIETALAPTYVKKTPTYDGWGSVFQVGYNSTGESYSIASMGADKKFNQGTQAGSVDAPMVTGNFDCDIIFSDGTFVMYPEGVQSQ